MSETNSAQQQQQLSSGGGSSSAGANTTFPAEPDSRYWLPLEAKALVQPLGSENQWAEIGDGRCELDGLCLRVVQTIYEKNVTAASLAHQMSGLTAGSTGGAAGGGSDDEIDDDEDGLTRVNKADIMTNSDAASTLRNNNNNLLPRPEDEDFGVEEVRSVLIEDQLTEDTPLVGDNMCIVWNSIEQHLSLCIMFTTEEAFAATWAAIHSAQKQTIPPIKLHIDAMFPNPEADIPKVFVEYLFADDDNQILSGAVTSISELTGGGSNSDGSGASLTLTSSVAGRKRSNSKGNLKRTSSKGGASAAAAMTRTASNLNSNNKRLNGTKGPNGRVSLFYRKKALQQIERYAVAASIIEGDFLVRFPHLFFSMEVGSTTTTAVGSAVTTTINTTTTTVTNSATAATPQISHPRPRVAVGLLLLGSNELLEMLVYTGLPEDEDEELSAVELAAKRKKMAGNNNNQQIGVVVEPLNPLLALTEKDMYDCAFERWIRTLDHVYGNDDEAVRQEIFGTSARVMSPKLSASTTTAKGKQTSSAFSPNGTTAGNTTTTAAPSPAATSSSAGGNDDGHEYPLNVPVWTPPPVLHKLPMAISLQRALNASLRLNFLRNEVLPHGGVDVARVIQLKGLDEFLAECEDELLNKRSPTHAGGVKKIGGGGSGSTSTSPNTNTNMFPGSSTAVSASSSPAASHPASPITSQMLLQIKRAQPIEIDEDMFAVIDQLHHRLLNEVLCSMLVDDEKKLLPQAVVQLLVLPSGKRVRAADMPTKVIEALESIRAQENEKHAEAALLAAAEKEDTNTTAEKENSKGAGGKGSLAKDGDKKKGGGAATTKPSPPAKVEELFPTMDDFLSDLVKASNSGGKSSSSPYNDDVIPDPEKHVREHLKFFSSMLSLAIIAFTKELLPAVVAKLFAPGLLTALSFVVKHYVCRDGTEDHPPLVQSSATATAGTTNINSSAPPTTLLGINDFSYSAEIDDELATFLQIAIVKLNEKGEEAVLNELVRTPITVEPDAHYPLLRYFVRAAMNTTAPESNLLSSLSPLASMKSGGGFGGGNHPMNPNSPLYKKKNSNTSASPATANGGGTSGASSSLANLPVEINISFRDIGTNNMLLFHLLGLHDDEGSSCERFSDPTINTQREAFHKFLITKVLAKEVLRLRDVEAAAYEDFSAFPEVFGTVKKPKVFLAAGAGASSNGAASRRAGVGIGGSSAADSSSASSAEALAAAPEVAYPRLVYLQALTMTMNETVVRVCEYMLQLCSTANKELLAAEVILNGDSVVLPWVDACAEAAAINYRLTTIRVASTRRGGNGGSRNNVSNASSAPQVTINVPANLLTGCVRFIRSIFNMCAPWFSVTGKTSHVAALFASAPAPPPTISLMSADTASPAKSSLDTAVVMDTSTGSAASPSGTSGNNGPLNDSTGSNNSSLASPIMKRQDNADEFDSAEKPIITSAPSQQQQSGTNGGPPPRPLSQPMQFAKDWVTLVTFRLLLSWRSAGRTGGGSPLLPTTPPHTPRGGEQSNSNNSSTNNSGAAAGGPCPTTTVPLLSADRIRLFSGTSKTILHHYFVIYKVTGGARKNGLFHSTLRSLLQLLESDINPLELPGKGIGSFQKYNLEDRKNYFIGKFEVSTTTKSKDDDDSSGENKKRTVDSDDEEEEEVTLDEAVMKLKYLILGRLNLLSQTRQSLLTAHRALLPIEFIHTWDEVAMKNAQEAAAHALAAKAMDKQSSAAVADICRSLRESYQDEKLASVGGGSDLNMKSGSIIEGVSSSTSGGGGGGGIGMANGSASGSSITVVGPDGVATTTNSPSTSGGGGGNVNTSLFAAVAPLKSAEEEEAGLCLGVSSVAAAGGTGGGSFRRASNGAILHSPHPARSPSPADHHNSTTSPTKAGTTTTSSPARRSPINSCGGGTPPPRMVDELSLFHPPMEGGGSGNVMMGIGSASGGGNAASGGSGSNANNTANPSAGGSGGANNNTSSSSAPAGPNSAFPRKLRDMMHRISPNTSPMPARMSPFAGGASGASPPRSSNNSSSAAPAPPINANATVSPYRASPNGSYSSNGGGGPQRGGTSPIVGQNNPTNGGRHGSVGGVSGNGINVSDVRPNTSGRVSPKLPSRPVAEPPMRRRHLRADGSSQPSTSTERNDSSITSPTSYQNNQQNYNNSSSDGGIGLPVLSGSPPLSAASPTFSTHTAAGVANPPTGGAAAVTAATKSDSPHNNSLNQEQSLGSTASPRLAETVLLKAGDLSGVTPSVVPTGGADGDEDVVSVRPDSPNVNLQLVRGGGSGNNKGIGGGVSTPSPSPSVSPASVMFGHVLPTVKDDGNSLLLEKKPNNTATTGSDGGITTATSKASSVSHTPTPPPAGGPSLASSASSSALAAAGGAVKRRPSAPSTERPTGAGSATGTSSTTPAGGATGSSFRVRPPSNSTPSAAASSSGEKVSPRTAPSSASNPRGYSEPTSSTTNKNSNSSGASKLVGGTTGGGLNKRSNSAGSPAGGSAPPTSSSVMPTKPVSPRTPLVGGSSGASSSTTSSSPRVNKNAPPSTTSTTSTSKR